MVKVLSLFSGIGAFEKALDRLNMEYELVNYCEIDKYAAKTYAMIHECSEDKNLGDITKVDTSKLPSDIDFITYGFPCQDISLAGKQKGFENEEGKRTRSGLFFEALRIIEDTNPKVAICENVKNLTGKKFKKEFEIVLSSLEQAGYTNYWQVLNAKDYGIPQNRERVFIISIRKDLDNGLFKFPEPFELKKRLKDILENEVEEKYFLSETAIKGFQKHNENHTSKGTGFIWKPKTEEDIANCLRANGALCPTDNTIKVIQLGNCMPTSKRENPNQGRIYDKEGLSPTLNTMQGGNRQPFIIEENKKTDKTICLNSKGGRGGVEGLQPSLQDRIYDSEGISPACTTSYMPSIAIREATKKGYAEAFEGDSVNLEQPNSKTRRGRVGKQVAQTLLTSCNQGVVIGSTQKNAAINYEGICPTLTSSMGTGGGHIPMHNYDLKIRKLTPRECFRLMGFDDEDFNNIKGISNSQLYKMAGNSIVVDVLVCVFEEIFKVVDFKGKEKEIMVEETKEIYAEAKPISISFNELDELIGKPVYDNVNKKWRVLEGYRRIGDYGSIVFTDNDDFEDINLSCTELYRHEVIA